MPTAMLGYRFSQFLDRSAGLYFRVLPGSCFTHGHARRPFSPFLDVRVGKSQGHGSSVVPPTPISRLEILKLCDWGSGALPMIHNQRSRARKLKMCKTLPNWHFGDFYCPHGPWPTEASNPPDFDPNPCNLKFHHNFEYPGAPPADPQNGLLAWLGAKQDPPQPPPKHGNIVSCSRSKRVPTEKYRKSRKKFFRRCG